MTYKWKDVAIFLIPSIFGIFCFIFPFVTDNGVTILITYWANLLKDNLTQYMPEIIMITILLSIVISLVTKLFQPKIISHSSAMNALFDIPFFWFVIRIIGAVFAVFQYLQIGPEAIFSCNTGGMIMSDLLPTLWCIFLLASFLLPLLINFGLIELTGNIMYKVMKPLFNLPGEAAVNCITSFLGDGSIGVLMTDQQYKNKMYTQKEAVIISTNFTFVSITFAMVIANYLGLAHHFLAMYLTVCLVGIILAIIIPRIPPISSKLDAYIDGQQKKYEYCSSTISQAPVGVLQQAISRAKKNKPRYLLVEALHNMAEMMFGVLPVVMAIGTLSLMLVEYTSFFDLIGKPFISFLELLKIPEPIAASKTILIGFADMFIPAILIGSVDNELTRFIIGALSLSQLIFLSEIGALILASKIPLNFLELFIIFLLRTLIGLPIISLIGHILYQ